MAKRPAGTGGLRRRGGSWQSTARDPRTGKQQWHSWPRSMSQREVERAHAEWVAEVVGGRAGDRRMTVGAFLDRWLATMEPQMYPSTVHRRRHDVAVLKEHLGSIRLADFNTLDVIDLLEAFNAQGLSPSTIKSRRTTLGMAMRDSVAWGLRPTNPVSAARSRRHVRPLREVPTTEQMRKLLQLEQDPMWHLLWATLAGTGMRPGEALALRFGDIDLDARAVIVRRTMTRDFSGQVIVGTTTKTKKPRRVSISDHLADEVRAWRAHCASIGLDRARPEAQVFPGWGKSGVVSQTVMNRAWHEVSKAAGMDDKVTPHAVRHWVASSLMLESVPPQLIATSLGMSITEVTQRYGVHAPPERVLDVVHHLPALHA